MIENQLKAALVISGLIGPVIKETVSAMRDDGRIDGREALRIGARLASQVHYHETQQSLRLTLAEVQSVIANAGIVIVDDPEDDLK